MVILELCLHGDSRSCQVDNIHHHARGGQVLTGRGSPYSPLSQQPHLPRGSCPAVSPMELFRVRSWILCWMAQKYLQVFCLASPETVLASALLSAGTI